MGLVTTAALSFGQVGVAGSSLIKFFSDEKSKSESLSVDVDLVLVPVTVTDSLDRLVIGLSENKFRVYDDGNPQLIRHFYADDVPISLGVIFDTSSSMSEKIEQSREAALDFFRNGNPEDEVFLIGFNDRPEILANFTSSIDDIETEISRVKPDGTTALLDAVYLGLNRMRDAKYERKVLLIISDGGDNHSRYNMHEVFSRALESGVQIDALGIFDETPRTKAERLGPSLLNALTRATGGRILPIRNLKSIGDAATKLAVELRNEYVIAYRPDKLMHDGRWHRITVRLSAPQDMPQLHVYAKPGYYAPDYR